MVIRTVGDTALLVEVSPDHPADDALREVLAIRSRLARSRPHGIVDLVPAARTVLVRWDPRLLPPSSARGWVELVLEALRDPGVPAGAGGASDAEPGAGVAEIGIRYDGPDLHETAALLGIRPDELVARHLAATWTVAFTGFAPGFGYLVSDDWPYEVPRLASPRTRVPAGAVGLAAGFTGAYPRSTPGGWRLIGSTSAPLFDPDASSPALLRPGMTVRFRSVDAVPGGHVAGRAPVAERALRVAGDAGEPAPAARVETPGLIATVQDAGRPGAASVGVAVSGALDRAALRTANRLVGNDEEAAAIEIAAGGFEAVAVTGLWIAVTGAQGPITIDDRPIDHSRAQQWPAGTRLRIGWFTAGARAYLALRGGVAAAAVLGSCATDTLSGLGPAPLRPNDPIRLGVSALAEVPPSDLAPWSPPSPTIEVRVVPGPRADAFTPAARAALFDAEWTVSAAADRIGMRLDGPSLERLGAEELPSEGMVPGAIQVPPGGTPTILLADGPVTGGYPVVATVVDADLDALGQASAGTRIRFRHAVLR